MSLRVTVDGRMALPSDSHLGYNEVVARKAAWQVLRSKDPGSGMLRRFAPAAAIPLDELVNGPGAGGRKT